jgi:hypothetical protein
VNESLHRERLGPTLTLAAQLAEAQKNQVERDRLLAEAKRVMASISALGEWELWLLKTATQMLGDADLGKAADRQLQKRKVDRGMIAIHVGILPEANKN